MNKITETTTKIKEDGTGGYPMLKVSYQVIKKVGTDKEGSNRLIFDNLILEHKNPKVKEITDSKIDKYLKSVGVEGGFDEIGNDYSRLVEYTELPFIANVIIKKSNNPDYNDKNEVKAYKRR